MATFKMNLTSLHETLLEIEHFIDDLDEKSQYVIMLLSEELLTNLVRHANFEDRVPDITLNIQSNEKNTFTLECKDNAKAFNPLEHKDPNNRAKIEDRDLGGLGIYLLKKYTKGLNYSFENGFNILRLSL